MQFLPGKCANCLKDIMLSGAMLPNYVEVKFLLADGNYFVVGFCVDCAALISSKEFASIVQAMNDYSSNYGYDFKAVIEEIVEQKNYRQLLLESQNYKCMKCGNDLGDYFSISNGRCVHDPCAYTEVPELTETASDVVLSLDPVNARKVVNGKYVRT